MMDSWWSIIMSALGIVMGAVMTLALMGAVYANRTALPMVGAVFVAILVFGAVW